MQQKILMLSQSLAKKARKRSKLWLEIAEIV
jgi:hypothetical protein